MTKKNAVTENAADYFSCQLNFMGNSATNMLCLAKVF